MNQPLLAEKDFREALKRDPDADDALTELGTVLLTQQRPDEALVEFRRCLESHDLHGPRVGAARALIMLGKPEEALLELNHVLATEPNHDVALLQRGKLHLAADRHDAAVKDFEFLCRLRTGGAEHR
jgi:Tfp pilus assembly protein PilF